MRDDDRLSDDERRLNLVLRPGDESVARVIAGALRRRQQRPRRSVGVIGASVLALAVAAAFLWRGTAPSPAPLVISGSGSIVVVTSDDGRRWLIQSQQSPPARGAYVIVFPQ
jgi:peptidoglycan/LPS O-acetylase OafA/YrhL